MDVFYGFELNVLNGYYEYSTEVQGIVLELGYSTSSQLL